MSVWFWSLQQLFSFGHFFCLHIIIAAADAFDAGGLLMYTYLQWAPYKAVAECIIGRRYLKGVENILRLPFEWKLALALECATGRILRKKITKTRLKNAVNANAT